MGQEAPLVRDGKTSGGEALPLGGAEQNGQSLEQNRDVGVHSGRPAQLLRHLPEKPSLLAIPGYGGSAAPSVVSMTSDGDGEQS